MPPRLSGGLPCGSADVADIASTQAKTPVRIRFMEASLCRIACDFNFCWRDHAARHAERQGASGCGDQMVAFDSRIFRKAEWCGPDRNMLYSLHAESETIRYEGQKKGRLCRWPRQLRQD